MTHSSNEDEPSPDEVMLLDDLQSQDLDTIFESDPNPGITFDLQEQDLDTFERGDVSDGYETR